MTTKKVGRRLYNDNKSYRNNAINNKNKGCGICKGFL